MTGTNENMAVAGDWLPPDPISRAFFTSSLDEDVGLESSTMKTVSHRTEELFLGPKEQKSNSQGGLVERIAARAGFNAPRLNTESIRSVDLSLNSDVRSPYLTIPPGLSPTTLLDSPAFLSNSLHAQPSPTTGKFPFVTNGTSRNSMLMSELIDKGRFSLLDDPNTSSFAFKPGGELGSPFLFGALCKMAPSLLHLQSFPTIEDSIQSENSIQSHSAEPSNASTQDRNGLHPCADFSQSCTENEIRNNNIAGDQGPIENSPSLDEQADEEGEQRGSGDSMISGSCGVPSKDGYNWRKYGQKQVKGSEFPRSYYKCTHPNCQVKKKVERSIEGLITEIIYKGTHNHPKPPSSRRSATGSSNHQADMQLEMLEQGVPLNVEDGDPTWARASVQKGNIAGAPDCTLDSIEVTSLVAVGGNESRGAVDYSSTFSNDNDDDDDDDDEDGVTHASVPLGYEGLGDESESKRRKVEAYATEMSGATRAIREPRVVVQTTSEVDILDDSYRWRKYGQKVVKGNPNPRSYYKCTNPGCTVRKHVERASHDLKSVITTYEGKHNHDVPAARNSSHLNSGMSGSVPAQRPHLRPSDMYQMHNGMPRFERRAAAFAPVGRQQMGPTPSHDFSFAMAQPGLANLAMAQPRLPPGLPIHPYLVQHHHQTNEMGCVLPKGEAKLEPSSNPGLNLSNGSSIYQNIMSRLPLGL